jgi:hypothetical protein
MDRTATKLLKFWLYKTVTLLSQNNSCASTAACGSVAIFNFRNWYLQSVCDGEFDDPVLTFFYMRVGSVCMDM